MSFARLRARLRSGTSATRLVIVFSALVVATAVAAPLASGAGEGSLLKGGNRNPAGGDAFSRETKIVVSSSGYGTRQSNLGSGSGAIYGCRAPAGGRGCVEASNLSDGAAFRFRFDGLLGGSITTSSKDAAKAAPFVTNATAVAKGLNADRVDGKDADELLDEAASRTKAAVVTAAGELHALRGVTSSAREEAGKYLVTFDADVSRCVPQVTAFGSGPGANAAVDLVEGKPAELRVFTQTGAGGQADLRFAITVSC